jgi:2-polyprenyl-3-methyl-5-hydroxy-6-metoxy-1,4-benzoquinol methylase
MNEFDVKAAAWDQNPMHRDRSETIANDIKMIIPLNREMTALEYGAGTGITSFLLKDHLKMITLMDNSAEMVKVMNEKIISSEVNNMIPLNFDLEHNDYRNGKFDLILTQMVLHHVSDYEAIIMKFHNLLNPGGYLAIADLYPEDGSFHGEGFDGHKGFDPEKLSSTLREIGFSDIAVKKCYVIDKNISETEKKQFDVFLLTASLHEISI